MSHRTLMTSTAKRVVGHVSSRAGVPVETMMSHRRGAEVDAARRRAARIFRRMGYSSTDIGFAMNRDHSTILWWLGRYQKDRRAAA